MKDELNITTVKRIILEDATEDITGLYEIIWTLNGGFEYSTANEKIEISKRAFRDLLNAGHIDLYRKTWTENDEQLVSPDDYDRVIDDNTNWERPNSSGQYYCFYQTKSTRDELLRQLS